MPLRARRGVIGSFVLVGAIALTGVASSACSSSTIASRMGLTSGQIRLTNQTGRLVRVELLSVGRDSSPAVWSTQLLAMDAEFVHGSSQEQRLPGMRARFSLVDDAPGLEAAGENINTVTLGVPTDTVRVYELRITNGRLTAREIGVEAGRGR
jgi:hypothetical protein